MRFAILLAAILPASAFATADAVRITSPDHAQTFAYGELISHRVYLDRAAGELAARLVFSNSPYADSNDPARCESFDFRFRGVRFNSSWGIFYARSDRGELIPVARFGKALACSSVGLAPGAKIYLVKESGRVTATLTATNYPRTGTQWVQTDNNLSLQNMLAALFGEFFPGMEN